MVVREVPRGRAVRLLGEGLRSGARSRVRVLLRKRRWEAGELVGALPAPVVGVAGPAGSGRWQGSIILETAVGHVDLLPANI